MFTFETAPYPGSTAVNFIIERFNGLYLPHFNATTFASINFWHTNGVEDALTSRLNTAVEMTSNCLSDGLVLASPGDVDSSHHFTIDWKRMQPYNNSC